mmetsp:Transcript_52949/g.115624  ORF Transcript_52949/g.115624 Transcript_52949/m.115624 type:complete len:303 (+) Transcript_52949:93-1001(+)
MSTELVHMDADVGSVDRPFDNLLVEIAGAGSVEPILGQSYGEAGPVDVDGERGRVVRYDEAEGRYVVYTFGGLIVHIAEEHLVEYDPPEPEEEGGFDVAWPTGPLAQGVLAGMVSETLQDKGYCVIQMFEGEQSVGEVRSMVHDLHWGVLGGDFEEEYLGEEPAEGKVSWLSYEEPREDGRPPAMATYSMEELGPDVVMDGRMSALERVDRAMTNVAGLMWPLAPEFEDEKAFNAWGRTTALVRAGFEKDDTRGVRRNVLGNEDADSLDVHLQFSDSKKICIMYLVDSEGGELQLVPQPEAY